MIMEVCARCEQPAELVATTLGWLCEDCAWISCELDGEGQITWPLEQAPGRDRQAAGQQGQQ